MPNTHALCKYFWHLLECVCAVPGLLALLLTCLLLKYLVILFSADLSWRNRATSSPASASAPPDHEAQPSTPWRRAAWSAEATEDLKRYVRENAGDQISCPSAAQHLHGLGHRLFSPAQVSNKLKNLRKAGQLPNAPDLCKYFWHLLEMFHIYSSTYMFHIYIEWMYSIGCFSFQNEFSPFTPTTR